MMANRHFYIGIENLNLNAARRQTLMNALKALGPASDSQPAHLNHWRTRLDGQAIILEALFDEDDLTVSAFKQRLADIFSVAQSAIGSASQQVDHGLVVTFSYGATDYLRSVLFGGASATWGQSGNATRAYLIANAGEWG